MREAERKGALSRLRRFGDKGAGTETTATNVIPICAPADGRVLRVMRESEGPLSAGTPLMEVLFQTPNLTATFGGAETNVAEIGRAHV